MDTNAKTDIVGLNKMYIYRDKCLDVADVESKRTQEFMSAIIVSFKGNNVLFNFLTLEIALNFNNS